MIAVTALRCFGFNLPCYLTLCLFYPVILSPCCTVIHVRTVTLCKALSPDPPVSPETHSSQWYSWGAAHLGGRLCAACWDRWKKYGGVLKPSAEEASADRPPSVGDSEHSGSTALVKLHRCPAAGCLQEFRQRGQLIRHAANAHGLLLPGTGSSRPVTRTRPSFFLAPTPMTRLSRRLCRHLIKPRRAARTPIHAINVAAIRAECEWRMGGEGEGMWVLRRGGKY